MHMTRRALLRSLGALAATAACGEPLSAANRADLAAGSFVWQPRLAPSGPLLIAYSADDELVRVYRGGVEIGISTCRVRAPQEGSNWSVFALGDETGGTRRAPFTWSGAFVHGSSPRGRLNGLPAVELPRDFGRLLAEATSGPGTVVLAAASLHAGTVTGGGLLPGGASLIETQALAANNAHLHVAGSSAAAAAAVVVVSASDRTACLTRPGHAPVIGSIDVQDPDRPLGDRLLSLVELGATADRTRWLAVDIGPQLSPAAQALGRVSLSGGQLTPYIVASALGPGSTLLLTDGPAQMARASGRTQPLFSSPVATAPRERRASFGMRRVRSAEAADPPFRPLKFFRDY